MTQPIDPRTMTDPLERALCVMYNESLNGNKWLTAADVSRELRDKWGISLHWRTIGSLLDRSKILATRKKKNKRWYYSLLDAGLRMIGSSSPTIQLIDPGKAVQNIVTLHGILSELGGAISVCDPYLDASTIEHLDSCDNSSIVRILTHNIRDSGKLRQLLQAFQSGNRQIEIRRTKKAVLHDRYIYDEKRLFILGASLNGFGKKQSFIIAAGPDIRSGMETIFVNMWKHAECWP